MDGILETLAGLAEHHVFVTVLQEKVEPLAKAREELAKAPPSLPDSDFDEQPGTAIMYGDGNQQYNSFGGMQTNVSGHYFSSRGAQNFGPIHFHSSETELGKDLEVCHVLPFPRNGDIIDRAHVFDRLESRLPVTCDEYQSAALYGLGGSGKTQVALEYAYRRCRDPACFVFWVHAENETTFSQDYKTIAEKLGLAENLDGQKLLAAVRERIERLSRWLLVLDNADDLALFRYGQASDNTLYGRTGAGKPTGGARSLYEYVPLGATGTVLWTSRDERVVTLVGKKQGIPVSEMSAEEAMSLLGTSRCREINKEEAEDSRKLLEELQWLPLAISQAGAYMRRTSTPMSEYLSRLTEGKERWRVLKKAEFDLHRRGDVPNSILETWSISIERIRQDNEMAYKILHAIAYVSNQDIPLEIMAAAGTFGEKQKGKPREEKDRVVEAVTRLREFSFLRLRTSEGSGQRYEMHKLVQEATRYGLSVRSSKYRVYFSRSAKYGVYFSRRSKYGAYFSNAALQIVAGLFPSQGPEEWAESEKYLAHAVQVGEWAEMSKNEVEVSNLLMQVSYYLFDRGRWREKEPVNERILELRRQVLGERHPHTILSMGLLGSTYYCQGRYEEAEATMTKVLELERQVLGERDPRTIQSMRFLATIYIGRGLLDEAEAIQTKALELWLQIRGERHPGTLSTMASLGTAYQAQGRVIEAEAIQTKVLELRRQVLGERHPDTIWSIASLGATYHRQGRYDEAEAIATEVLELRRQILGERHPDSLETMHNLAIIWGSQGRCDDAIALMGECLKLKCSILGPNHPHTKASDQTLRDWKIPSSPDPENVA